METITIYFDMDGTIADLYNYENWLTELRAEDPHPYEIAKPLIRFSTLARILNRLQRNGYNLGVISWGSKNATEQYNQKVYETKRKWLQKHLTSVHWDEINLVSYGTPKSNFAHTENDILFDDELSNRKDWIGQAYTEKEIIKVLKIL